MQALGELGGTCLLQDDFSRGAECLRQAFDEAAGAGLATEMSLFANNHAMAHVALAQWDEAERFNQAAARFGAQASRPPSPYTTVNKAQIALGRGKPDEATRLFRSALEMPGVTPHVEWTAHEGLARVAIATGRIRDARGHFETALQRLERTRVALVRADYRISFTSRLRRSYRAYVDLLLADGQVERALEVADASRARLLGERQAASAPQARTSAAALRQLARRARSTLVFYWLGPDPSWVWALTGDRITVTALAAAPQIETLVAEYQAAIQNAMADSASAGSSGERLCRALVEPSAPMLTSAVLLVPDGCSTSSTSRRFGSPGPRRTTGPRTTPSRWPRRWRCSSYGRLDTRLPHGRAALRLPCGGRDFSPAQRDVGPPNPATLLPVVNPSPRPPEFPALGYAAAEMRQVKASFPSTAVSLLDGERATSDAFRTAEPGRFQMIHFTSHAIANIESPLDSSVILSGPDQGFRLYARDVAAMPLTAKLVTVSACRGAGERAYAGEALVGFAWAFLRAGSRRVIAGLWDVDDRSTATLMGEVYRRIASGEPPAGALRSAKRALVQQGFAKPYYWAPFNIFTVVL